MHLSYFVHAELPLVQNIEGSETYRQSTKQGNLVLASCHKAGLCLSQR